MTEKKKFIETIGRAAVSAYGKYKILPSLTIAQAILVSNWGKSGLSKECFNYFGMKWREGCGCGYKEYSTKEQRKDGTVYTIKAKFCKYGSVEEGIRGYYDFLSGYKRYHNLIGVTNADTACDLIRADGWATSLKYAESLKKMIRTYALTDYDRMALGEKKYYVRIGNLRVRTGPGTEHAWTGRYCDRGYVQIAEVREGKGSIRGWGRLSDGSGWISMDYLI